MDFLYIMDCSQNLWVETLVIMEPIPKNRLKFQVIMFLWCFSKYVGVYFFLSVHTHGGSF